MDNKRHSPLPPSSAARWIACPPSALKNAEVEDKPSEAALEGTAAHTLCEYKVKTALGEAVENPIENLDYYNAEMEEHTDGYLQYVLEQVEKAKETCKDPIILVEQRLDFTNYVPHGFGTGDCVIVADDNLTVIDFKYGLGVLVEAENNPQMMCYAIGALNLFDANVWEAKSINGSEPKYSVSLIIPKSDTKTVNKIRKAIQAAYTEGESKLKGNGRSVPPLKAIKTPLRDGDIDRPDDEAYKNSYFINANSKTAPGIVDADRQPILDRNEVYSGCYGRASISFYAFNSNGNKGIACSLNHLQKFADGESLGGKSSAEEDFADIDDEDDDIDEDFLWS